MSPAYNTLLMFDLHNYPQIVGDLAKSWTVSNDHLTLTFTLHEGVTFHAGSPLTSADVKAVGIALFFRPRARSADTGISMSRSRASRLPIPPPWCFAYTTPPPRS
jgi:ABC-type oligopeptide transport system substrate-binding subunit